MDSNEDAYRGEHWLAWILGALAVLLGAVGALEAFDILNVGDAHLSVATGSDGSDAGMFVDGALFLLPGVIAAFLAMTLHRSEHHEHGYSSQWNSANVPTLGDDTHDLRHEDDIAKSEHTGAYVATAASLAFSVIGVLVGFNVFDEVHTFYDGMTWLMLSLISSVLAATLHGIGHHMPVTADWTIRTSVDEGTRRRIEVPGETRVDPQTRR
jgi:hypothetical protein